MSQNVSYYEVEDVIGKNRQNGKIYYLIKWRGFPKEDATWEDISHLKYIKPLIKRFNDSLKNKKMKDISISIAQDNIQQIVGNQGSNKKQRYCERGSICLDNNDMKKCAKTTKIDDGKQLSKSTVISSNQFKPQCQIKQKTFLMTPIQFKKKIQSYDLFTFQNIDQKEKIANDPQPIEQERTVTTQQPTKNITTNCKRFIEFDGSNNFDFLNKKNSLSEFNLSQKPLIKAQNEQPKKIKKYMIMQRSECQNKFNMRGLQSDKSKQTFRKDITDSIKKSIEQKKYLNVDKPLQNMQPKSHQNPIQTECPSKTVKIKRFHYLIKNDRSGFQYMVEGEDNSLRVCEGRELIKAYPEQFLSYIESQLLRKLY